MSLYTKHIVHEVLIIALAWLLISTFYIYIKFDGIPKEVFEQIFVGELIRSKGQLYLLSWVIALPLGVILGILYTCVYPKLMRLHGSAIYMMLKAVILIGLTILIAILILFWQYSYKDIAWTLISSKIVPFMSILIYLVLMDTILGVFVLLRRSLGANYFINTLRNTYQNPKEELRVFMFLDMEDSTPTASRMGHLNFSKYIQDCFLDLSNLVLNFKGEVYQYVGDEAVITWKISEGFQFEECLNLYFSFQKKLLTRNSYYQQHYQASPVFRCALHYGTVSTALVGDYKQEIAYHGDVLNLCSRLQAVCKNNKAYVLVSKAFYEQLKDVNRYRVFPILLSELKGIKPSQIVYRIDLLV